MDQPAAGLDRTSRCGPRRGRTGRPPAGPAAPGGSPRRPCRGRGRRRRHVGAPAPSRGSCCGTSRQASGVIPAGGGRRRRHPRRAARRPGAAAAGRSARRGRLGLEEPRRVLLGHPGQAFQRQAEADRAVAGHQEHVVAAEEPAAGLPAPRAVLDHPADRQHRADLGGQPLAEHLGQPRPLQRVLQLGVLHHDVRRQALLAPEEVVDVLIGRVDQRGVELQPLGQDAGEAVGIRRGGVVGVVVRGQQRRVVPDRLAIRGANANRAPSAAAARPGSACPWRIAARRRATTAAPAGAAAAGIAALGRAERRGVPFRRVHVVGGDEGRLAAHGQPDVAGRRAPRSTAWPRARMSCHCASV